MKSLFHAALERNADERAAFVNAACGEDAELKSHLNRLLEAEAQPTGTQDGPLAAVAEFFPDSTARFEPGETVLGRFHIVRLIGRGGMGEVYRARDSKLGRDVAIKVMPEAFARDRERRIRFEREAKFLAALNHPNIAAIYGVENAGSTDALVMELAEGPTLADHIASGPIQLAEALPIARQIADALEYAHEHGVVHRDLKPANIKVSDDGSVKVLDFGIAKAVEGASDAADIGNSATIPQMATKAGVLLGTAAYMSPEQVKAKPIDRRVDIWAFGCVLYEMLTGKKVFPADTVTETLAAVLTNEPDWSQLSSETPIRVRVLLHRCLQKDPKQRLRDIGDARISLDEVLSGVAEDAPTLAVAAPAWRRAAPWALLGTLAAILITAGTAFLVRPKPSTLPQPVTQFVVSQPPGTLFAPPISRQAFAISPDGTRLALTAIGRDGPRIWIRDLSGLDLTAIPGTEGAWTLFWSPDSRSLFFSVGNALKQIDLQSGAIRTAVTAPAMTMFGIWRSPDDLILYLGPMLYYELSTKTGNLQKLPSTNMRWAQFLPDSNRFLHVVFEPELGHYRAFATDYLTHQSASLMQTDSRVQYSPPRHPGESGYLLFLRGATLLAQPFDADRLKLTGDAFPLVQNVLHFRPSASACFSVSSNGILVYQSGFPQSDLRWYDRTGNIIHASPNPAPFTGTLRISPDGNRVAAGLWSTDYGGVDIWLYDQNAQPIRRLTYPPLVHGRPVWSRDGTRIATSGSSTGAPTLQAISLDQSGKEMPLLDDAALKQRPMDQIQAPTDWSQDGRFIAYDDSLGEDRREVWVFDLTANKLSPLLKSESSHWGAVFSPDVRQIAFVSDESGRPEVYVQALQPSPIPHPIGEPDQVSRGGAWLVRWRPDGRELFFVGTDSRLYALRIEHGSAAGEATQLFELPGNPHYGTPSDFQFDVSKDGQHFVMTTTGSATPPDFTIIQNWQDKFHH